MGSLSGIYIGSSGLNVNQTALNVTAHNLSNVDTQGFVRQQVVTTDYNYIKLGETYISSMQQGLGANIATVKQVRDAFLDQAYRQEAGRQAFYESQSQAIDEVEGFFGEMEGVSFQQSLDDLWTSLQELGKEPDSMVARSSLIESSVSFLERANNISDQLNNYQLNLNTDIQNQVNHINEIGNKISTLNKQIRQDEGNGLEHANDLRDQRNALLDDLGKIANIKYKENADGVVTVNLEGVPFVTDTTVYQMGTAKISDSSDILKPVWPAYENEDVFNFSKTPSAAENTDIGSLKGLLIARGSRHTNYTDIPQKSNYATEEDYNNAVNDYNKNIDPSAVMTIQAQFDQLIHGIVTTINNVLCPNKEVTLNDSNHTKIKILDEENAPIGSDSDKTAGEALFNRKTVDRYSEPQEIEIINSDGTTSTITARVYNEEDKTDNYSLYTLGEIEVNQNILKNNNLMPLLSKSGSGNYAVSTVQKLLTAWKTPFSTLSPDTLTENNFNDYYTSFISEIANRGEKADTISDNQGSMVTSLDNQRSNVAGVSSDEELTNMIKFQQAYNASARYINVVDEMLEHIVKNL